jgi:hypothetical protein
MANPLICVFNPVTSFIDEVQSVSSGPASNGIPIVTNLLGVIDTSLLGIGTIATAGQAIGAGNLVNLYSFAGTLHAQIASAQNGGGSPPAGPFPLQAQGFAAGNAVIGGPLTVSFFGTFKYVDGNSEFNSGSIGAEVYLSDRGDGSPTLTPPSGGGELEQSVGYVVAFVSPNVVTINFASGFQDFTHISGVNPITKGGTGATTGAQALINLIGGSPAVNDSLIWNGSAWVPGTDLAPFSEITSGTNTSAAMVVGTGASLSFSGSGTINANQLTGDPVNTAGRTTGQALVWSGTAWTPSSAAITAFNDLTSGTNTVAAMVVGTGASLSFSGTGTVNANQIVGTTVSGTTGTGNVVFDTAPTISGATLSGTITISGTATFTTANPTFFSQTGSGAVVLATSPTLVTPVLGVAAATSLATSSFISVGTTITSYNGIATVANGVPSIYGTINLLTQTGNTAATPLVASASAGLWSITVYTVVSQAATTSSTLPDTQIIYTDQDSGAIITVAATAGDSTNTTSTFAQATFIVNATAASAIQIAIGQSTPYASSGVTPMQFAYRARAAFIG